MLGRLLEGSIQPNNIHYSTRSRTYAAGKPTVYTQRPSRAKNSPLALRDNFNTSIKNQAANKGQPNNTWKSDVSRIKRKSSIPLGLAGSFRCPGSSS
uniref:Ovule protein n=1 Tax=Steinernema glaseri TaxID=37863 RepID=A0A1I7ZY11_9BILA